MGMNNRGRSESEDMRRLNAEAERLRFVLDPHRWSVSVGPVRLRAFVGSQRVFRMVLAGHLLLAAAGASLVLLPGEPWRSLGVALLTGAMFGLGGLGVSWWEQVIERERDYHRLSLDERLQLEQRLETLADRIAALGRDAAGSNEG